MRAANQPDQRLENNDVDDPDYGAAVVAGKCLKSVSSSGRPEEAKYQEQDSNHNAYTAKGDGGAPALPLVFVPHQ